MEENKKSEKIKSNIQKLEEIDSFEKLSLNNLLRDLIAQLNSVEKKLSILSKPSHSPSKFILDFFKIFLGGWPAFGLLFIILFYSPIKEAFKSIPEKVKSASEIKVGEVSLKSTIVEVANTQGLGNLGEVLPMLSNSAIKLLLRAPNYNESLISFTNYPDGNQKLHSAINLPSDYIIKALEELELKGLIKLRCKLGEDSSRPEELKGNGLSKFCEKIRKKYPGTEEDRYNKDEISWKLKNMIPQNSSLPLLSWELTEYGQKALDVVLEAVSKELFPTNNE